MNLLLVNSVLFSALGIPAWQDADINRVTMDVYIRPDSERCQDLVDYLDQLRDSRPGLAVVVHNVVDDLDARRELYALGDRYKIEKLGLPAIHVMNRFHVGYADTETSQKKVRDLLTIEVFTRDGCPRCRDAKTLIETWKQEWPALRFEIFEIVRDRVARDRMHSLARKYGVNASSVPAFHLCGQLRIGYQGPAITGRQIEGLIRQAARSVDSEPPRGGTAENGSGNDQTSDGNVSPGDDDDASRTSGGVDLMSSLVLRPFFAVPATFVSVSGLFQVDDSDQLDDLPPLPDEMDPLPESDASATQPVSNEEETSGSDEMEVPVLGVLSASRLGMPVFTFLVGLVDGFNPCAMWVLIFLLSVLVNIRDRRKILVIAGTFVFVSGLAYFAFMAAWLNVFMLFGLDRPAQVILGCLAILIGAINIKDFFAFGRGVSLSIPDSAKPGIYARVRKIVMAPNLWAALSGAIILAVLVNIIELLCTAGLPALYTQILVLQGYPSLVNYLYLMLYIVAYMLDDTLLVAVVVFTLSRKKLQESHGRWLKLISGLAILLLGVVMLLRPEWLV